MEHRYTTFMLTALLALPAAAQSIHITNGNGDVLNGSTQYIWLDAAQDVAELDLPVVNVSGDDKWVGLKRYEMGVQAGTQNYFCWDQCFLAADAGAHPVWEAENPLYLTHNVPVSNFHAYYRPQGHLGTSTFRYVWYTTADHNDSAWVDLVFNGTPAGIEENAGAVRSFSAYPNPSTTGAVTLDYELASLPSGSRLVVYNMLGERALVRTLGAAQGRVVLGNGELGAGIWFATIENNGRAVATRRLVITR